MKRKEKTAPFSVKSMRSQVSYQAAQVGGWKTLVITPMLTYDVPVLQVHLST